jgi:hypothetical protein
MFYLNVQGGLVSRLRSVVGAMAFADHLNTGLHVSWSSHQHNLPWGFDVRLSDVWQYDGTIIETDDRPKYGKEHGDWERDGGKLNTCHLWPFEKYFLTEERTLKPGLTDRFPLGPEVQRYVDAIEFGDRPVVGVQIRCWLTQPDSVPPEWYIDRMRKIAAEYDVQFFLNCDKKDVAEAVKFEFPGTLEQEKGDYKYDRPRILQSAADLYLMQKCDWMVGSNHSSWAEMAALMRGATYHHAHGRPGGVSGGNYEDAWNPGEAAVHCRLPAGTAGDGTGGGDRHWLRSRRFPQRVPENGTQHFGNRLPFRKRRHGRSIQGCLQGTVGGTRNSSY